MYNYHHITSHHTSAARFAGPRIHVHKAVCMYICQSHTHTHTGMESVCSLYGVGLNACSVRGRC